MQVRQSSQSDKKTDCASPPTFPEGPTPIQLGFLSRLPGQLYRSINLRILVVLYWTSYRPTDVQLSVCLCFSCRFERLSSTSGQHNLGLNSAWKRAQDRSKWRKLVKTAMSCQGRATRWWWRGKIRTKSRDGGSIGSISPGVRASVWRMISKFVLIEWRYMLVYKVSRYKQRGSRKFGSCQNPGPFPER